MGRKVDVFAKSPGSTAGVLKRRREGQKARIDELSPNMNVKPTRQHYTPEQQENIDLIREKRRKRKEREKQRK